MICEKWGFWYSFLFLFSFSDKWIWPRSVGKNGRNLGWVGFAWTFNFEALKIDREVENNLMTFFLF